MPAKKKSKKEKIEKQKALGIYEEPKIGTCILCGGTIQKKLDKRKRLYVRCYQCGSMLFLNSYFAELGYKIVEKLIERDPQAFTDEINRQIIEIRESKNKEKRQAIEEREMKILDKELGIKYEPEKI